MNSLPPSLSRGQTLQYPRSIAPEANDLERWKRLLASEAKIVAYLVANHVYGSLETRMFHDRLAGSWLVVNDHNVRSFALDFIAWDLTDLTRDFEKSSFTGSFDVLSRHIDALVDMLSRNVPGVRRRLIEGLSLTGDRKGIWCALAATRCRRELGDSTAVMRHHHAKAKTGRAALVSGGPELAQTLEHVEIVQECSKAAHVGIMRAMRYIQQRTEATYNEGLPLVMRLLEESSVVDYGELCTAHLQESAKRFRGLLGSAPDMREELMSLGLDSETLAVVSSCTPRRAADGAPARSTTLKTSAYKKTVRSRIH